MEEIWKPIPWALEYEVSTMGNVRSWKKYPANRKISSNYPRIIRTKPNTNGGYPMVALYHDGVKRVYSVHSLVAEVFIGKRKDNDVVCHKNDIKTDNRLENLEYGSRSYNSRQAVSNGKMAFGENHKSAKLTTAEVLEIRKLHQQGLTHKAIADIFNTSRHTISSIVNGRNRKHETL